MGDLVLRISLLVQRGFICSACGVEIDGEYSDYQRECKSCQQKPEPKLEEVGSASND